MATGQRDSILRYIRQVSGTGPVESDRTLLERFVRQSDGEAFATLVRRHGPMVYGVCRRILTCHQDADDAFQAVFLLLIRKAGSLRQPERLGPWLHGVAHRVALKARSVRQRRRREPLIDLSAPPVPDDLVWRDLRPVLDDAVRSLATKYRVPFVLCYLQGMTHAEAARQLRCPPGTIATRLSRRASNCAPAWCGAASPCRLGRWRWPWATRPRGRCRPCWSVVSCGPSARRPSSRLRLPPLRKEFARPC